MELMANYPVELCKIAKDFRDGKATLKDFNKKVEQLAQDKEAENKNKFKGDMLEILAWIFFKEFKNDPAVGLTEYTPTDETEDYGVDGTGINANGNKVAVQVKYKHAQENLVTYGDISKTYTSGKIILGLDLEKNDSIYVFTNAKDVTPTCKRILGNRVKVLNANVISKYINKNKNFWKSFYENVYGYFNV